MLVESIKKQTNQVDVMKYNRCRDSGRKDGLVEEGTLDCVWWVSWSVPGGQRWKEHPRPRGEADSKAWSSMLWVQTITTRWPFPKSNVPARKGQQSLIPEVESLGIKIRSFDLLPVLRQPSNIKRFLL